ncbi:MAG TPA: MarR family transcriptional regulator [Chloroflexota bacterium]|nr:MarR family transcriptional regulator [Chloroflexota bacterium]
MTEGQTKSVGAVEHEVTLLLRLVESARKRAEMLDRSAYLLLGELQARGPLGIAALAGIFQVDLSTASRQTAALEAKGLVQRLADPDDGRVSLLQITPLGQTELQTTRDARHALFDEILEGWSADERHRFGEYLARFNQAIVRRRLRANGSRALK